MATPSIPIERALRDWQFLRHQRSTDAYLAALLLIAARLEELHDLLLDISRQNGGDHARPTD